MYTNSCKTLNPYEAVNTSEATKSDNELRQPDEVYPEDITGTIGAWLSAKFVNVPDNAIKFLETAYEICAEELR